MKNANILQSYIKTEKEIEKRIQADDTLNLLYNRPINPFKDDWDETVENIHTMLVGENIVGFHCTRLIDSEIKNIRQNGLNTLDVSFINAKLDNILFENKITKETYGILRRKNVADERYRKGQICFFHCSATLTDCGGLHRLFRSWGGEALYYYYEDDIKIGNELRHIGYPCIVIVTFPYSELTPAEPIPSKMIKFKLTNKIEDFTTNSKHEIQARKIITISDPNFLKLTKYDKWYESII
jgi:hypothetical protein